MSAADQSGAFNIFCGSAQIGDIFYRRIVIDTGDFAVISGICFMNNFSVSHVNCHMTDIAASVFIEYQISRLQLAAADRTAACCLRRRGSGNTDSVKFINRLCKT